MGLWLSQATFRGLGSPLVAEAFWMPFESLPALENRHFSANAFAV